MKPTLTASLKRRFQSEGGFSVTYDCSSVVIAFRHSSDDFCSDSSAPASPVLGPVARLEMVSAPF
jgi:hypothetical protein